jgi:hypothetical protein
MCYNVGMFERMRLRFGRLPPRQPPPPPGHAPVEIQSWELTVMKTRRLVFTFDVPHGMAACTPISAARDMQGRLVIRFNGGRPVALPDMQGRVVDFLEAAPLVEVAMSWADGSLSRDSVTYQR